MILIFSAGLLGFVHSLMPSHWLPVVLMAKLKKWPTSTTVLGAIASASGHIFLSVFLGILSVVFENQFLIQYEHQIEKFSGLILAIFGLFYMTYSYFKHSSCHGHTHHGPDPKKSVKTPFLFLFTLGFFPCVAVLPLFVAASLEGMSVLVGTLSSFSIGVLISLISSTYLVSRKLMKLDLPIFEHYGDVLTGSILTIVGLVLFCL